MLLLKKYPHVLAGLILSAFFVVSLIVSSQDSTTMDEKAHIPSAYSYVRYGDMRLNPEHPPLLKDLAGLPLLLLNLNTIQVVLNHLLNIDLAVLMHGLPRLKLLR